jgi:hypothetical protein
MTTKDTDTHSPVPSTEPLALRLSEGLGPLPPQREGQYLTMTICGTNDDPAECGHWSSPAHVKWRIDTAVAAERERWQARADAMARALEVFEAQGSDKTDALRAYRAFRA